MTKARDIASAAPAPSTVSATELGYLDGVSSAIQTQIDSKIGSASAINPTIVDAKGDIIAATAADTVARLAVGSNDQVLTADSSTATGLKWATAASGFVGCRLTKSSVQSLSNATGTAITWDTEDFDTDGFHSTVSNTSRITIPSGKGGKYLITGLIGFDEQPTGTRQVSLYKNGANIYFALQIKPPDNTEPQFTFSTIQNLTVGDYLEIYAYQSSGGSLNYPRNSDVSKRADFAVQYLGA